MNLVRDVICDIEPPRHHLVLKGVGVTFTSGELGGGDRTLGV